MSNKSKAVIFDTDGLIIDFEPLWKRSEMTPGSIGYDFTYEMCESTKGMRIDEVVQYYIPNLNGIPRLHHML